MNPAATANRDFYDALWSARYLVGPERFNTWPRRRVQAMRWYNNIFLPLGLFLQPRLVMAAGLIDVQRVDELLLLCRRRPDASHREAP